jgi:hypothetical protein
MYVRVYSVEVIDHPWGKTPPLRPSFGQDFQDFTDAFGENLFFEDSQWFALPVRVAAPFASPFRSRATY